MAWKGYGQRIQQSVWDLQSQLGRPIRLLDIGRDVARAEGRAGPYTGPSVSSWIAERNEPTLAAFDAMAAVFGHRDGAYLAFNVQESKIGTLAPQVKAAMPPALELARPPADLSRRESAQKRRPTRRRRP